MTKRSDSGKSDDPDRRHFLGSGALATGAMAGGLALGYGMFFRSAVEYLYPAQEGTAWMFVSDVDSVVSGQAITFKSPNGVPVVITRKSSNSATAGESPTADEFLALSSVCPHLGCRVHWEPQNNRFFCPCHLGAFDPEGRPTAGPPLAANQALPEYPLKVENGLLYINMPVKPIDPTTEHRLVKANACRDDANDSPRLDTGPGEWA